jgi:AcrR family transcriptional regulator
MPALPKSRAKLRVHAAPVVRMRDPLASRARILAAAKAEFARKGLAGARVDTIADRARINKRMIYHYFGSKNGLYLAVLEEAYGDIRTAERSLDLEHLEPVAAITRLVEFTWDYYIRNPEFLRLINTENLHRAQHLKRSKRIADMHSPFVALIAHLLRRGAESGVFRDDLDPTQVYISMAALGYYYLTNQHTLSVIYGVDLGGKAALERRRAVIVDIVLSYLRKR